MTAVRAEPAKPLTAVWFDGAALRALDQSALPQREEELVLRSADEVADAIARLQIRGAPLIGVAAAYGVVLDCRRNPDALERACAVLRDARPTAVNLAHAVERIRAAAQGTPSDELADRALREAKAIHREEEAASDAIATSGADLLSGARCVLTHCNTGALAAPGRGTALAVLDELWRRGELDRVVATETRPLLQGARLTVYELGKLGIPHELVVDSAAPGLISAAAFDAVIVGCDRVAANGDVANKVGTYPLALAANARGIPFVVAGPVSTIDPECPSGDRIEIEQRDEDEVRRAGQALLTVPRTPCLNPAFDVTPAGLVTALVTDRGVAQPVGSKSLSALTAGLAGTPGAR